MESTFAFLILAIVVVLAGMIGLVLPALPGAPLIFAGLVLAAWAEDFTYVGFWTIVILAVVAVLTYAVDFWATMFGAKKFGASKRAVIGAILGLLVGIFLGFIGVIFGTYSSIAVASPIMVWWEQRLEAANRQAALAFNQPLKGGVRAPAKAAKAASRRASAKL